MYNSKLKKKVNWYFAKSIDKKKKKRISTTSCFA